MQTWGIGLTAAIALSAIASFTATAFFYWWTWKQRNPVPVLVSVSVLGNVDKPDELEFGVIVALTNPGEVPIHILSLEAHVCDPEAGITSHQYVGGDAGGAGTVLPHGMEALRSVVTLGAKCRETAFPEGAERSWDIELTYVSGGRHRRGAFRRVVRVARWGSSWRCSEGVGYPKDSPTPTMQK